MKKFSFITYFLTLLSTSFSLVAGDEDFWIKTGYFPRVAETMVSENATDGGEKKTTLSMDKMLSIGSEKPTKASIFGCQAVSQKQIDAMIKLMPNYKYSLKDLKEGEVRELRNPLFYNSKRWKLTNRAGFRLGSGQNVRRCTYHRLVDKHDAGIYVFQVDLSNLNKNAHETAVQRLLEVMHERKYVDEPVIVLGVLGKKNSSGYEALLREKDFRKAVLVEGTHTEGEAVLSTQRISAEPAQPHATKIVWDGKLQAETKAWRFLKETILDKEFGPGSGHTLRWTAANITVRLIGGTPRQRDLAKSVVREINRTFSRTGKSFTISEKKRLREVRCYIGTFEELKKIYKKESLSPPNDYAGFASSTWYTDSKIIIEGTVLIATDRSKPKELRGVMVEELTQSLGLLGDNTVLPESVTFSRGNDHGNASHLSELDKKAIVLMYKHLKTGSTTKEVYTAFKKYWAKL